MVMIVNKRDVEYKDQDDLIGFIVTNMESKGLDLANKDCFGSYLNSEFR